MYLNGNVILNRSGFLTDPFTVTRLFLGNDQDSVGGDFDIGAQFFGSFTDFRVYNKAKTLSEVTDIMNYICKYLIFKNIQYF